MIGATSIDFRDPIEAASEVRRCTKEYGFRAVYANPVPVSPYPLYHDSYEPLWNAMEECDVALAFHGAAGNSADQLISASPPDLQAGRGAIAFGIHYMLQCAALILNQYQGGMCIAGVLTTTERTPRHFILPLGPN